MGGARRILLLGNLALALLLVGTFSKDLGWTRAHHDAAYAALALAALASRRFLRRRRVTSLLLASFAAWSTLTGLLLVYVAPDIGYARGMRWWHGVTSVGLLLAFLAHWARNHPRLVQLAGRARRSPVLPWAFLGGWGLLVAVAAWSWTSPGDLFSDEYFRDLTTFVFVLVAATVTYTGLSTTSRRVRARLADPATRGRLRGTTDASLLLAMWLAALTGFPLLYAGRWLRLMDSYWLLAGWHVVTSALLLGLVAFHVGFNAKPLRAHAR